MSAGALRRSNLHRPDALPVEPLNQRHELRVAEPYLRAPGRRPAEVRVLQPLSEQTKSRPVPPDNFDSIRSLRAEHEKRPAERVGASITHQRNESVWPLAEIHRARSQEHARTGRHHA